MPKLLKNNQTGEHAYQHEDGTMEPVRVFRSPDGGTHWSGQDGVMHEYKKPEQPRPAQQDYVPIPAPVSQPTGPGAPLAMDYGPNMQYTDPGYQEAVTPREKSQAGSGMLWPTAWDEQGTARFEPSAGISGMVGRAFSSPIEAYRGEFDPASKEAAGRMLETASIMTPISPAARVPGSVFAPKSAYKTVEAKAPLVKDLKGQASKIYKEVESSKITISPQEFKGMVDGLSTRLQAAGFHPKMHPKSAGAFEAINDFVGKTITMQDMGVIRRFAKGAKNNIEPDEARIGRVILEHIDDTMRQLPGISEKLTSADKLWSMAKKTELLDKAVGAAKDAASGFENGLRIEFRKLLKKAREGKLQLSPQETAAMQKVVDGSIPANILKGIGKLGPAPGGAGNALLAVLAGTGGYALGGPAGMAGVMATGYGSRLGAQALTKGAAERARSVVSGRGQQQVYAPGITQDTMLKGLLAQQTQDQAPFGARSRRGLLNR